jgi:hypothetical protein
MSYPVVVLNKVRATDVDALNRVAYSADATYNGAVFELLTRSANAGAHAGESEVWVATASAGTLTNIWMAYSPEVVEVVAANGNIYKGIDNDPRNFYKPALEMIDCFRPMAGDIITMTADGLLTTSYPVESTYAVVTSGSYKLYWNTSAVSGLTLKYLETTYISLPQAGAISETQHVAAYKFSVYAVS